MGAPAASAGLWPCPTMSLLWMTADNRLLHACRWLSSFHWHLWTVHVTCFAHTAIACLAESDHPSVPGRHDDHRCASTIVHAVKAPECSWQSIARCHEASAMQRPVNTTVPCMKLLALCASQLELGTQAFISRACRGAHHAISGTAHSGTLCCLLDRQKPQT